VIYGCCRRRKKTAPESSSAAVVLELVEFASAFAAHYGEVARGKAAADMVGIVDEWEANQKEPS
jgi:hypothetical protein